MIDWIKASLPYQWTDPICGGHLLTISPDGEVERQIVKSAHVRGSHDEHLTLRTVQSGRVEFDGNPSKFLQGHNLCGSDDLTGLATAALEKALGILGRELSKRDRLDCLAGHFDIDRVDLTQMFELPTRADVRAWLRAASELARMKWRGRAKSAGEASTIYFGKVANGQRASTWSLKGYCKADELEARGKGHRLHERLPLRDELTAWADNKLRFEVLLRAAELRRYADGRYLRASNWSPETSPFIFNSYFGKMELGTNAMLPVVIEESLKPALRLAYTAWKSGHDLRGVLPHKTFYRYRRQLLDMTDGAIDLNVPQARSNVVPLRRVLEIQPAPNPAFLAGRPDLLYRRAA